MSLNRIPSCQLLSFDYLDFDVFLNVLVFYRLSGYRVSLVTHLSSCDLVVVLRGIPPAPYPDYRGIVHVYDYVKEYRVDYLSYFPNASIIYLVSFHNQLPVIESSPPDTPSSCATELVRIYGYLPVFPSIWRRLRNNQKSSTPLHIGNYKPISNDVFQNQLISLSRQGAIKIFGAKWDRVGIRASSLSYFAANHLLASAKYCFGLMYPYQRGSSLSGRMWQAPINGCQVISEPGTNIFDCPGVLESSDYSCSVQHLPQTCSASIAEQASSFWNAKTSLLASNLHLDFNPTRLSREVMHARILLFMQHLFFLYDNHISKNYFLFASALRSFLRGLIKRTY